MRGDPRDYGRGRADERTTARDLALTSSVNVVQSAFPELVITLTGLLLALLLPAPRAAVPPEAAPAKEHAG